MEPTTPDEAAELFLEKRRGDSARSTVQSYQYRLKQWLEWCSENDIEAVEELTTLHIHKFNTYLNDRIAKTTKKSYMTALRLLLDYMCKLNITSRELVEAVETPTLSGDDDVRSDILTQEEAEEVLEHLKRFEYASRTHIQLLLAWRVGARMSSIRALDLSDYDSEEQFLQFRDRADEGTSLKNGGGGERMVALSPDTCTVIDSYIEQNRIDVEDKHGRKPLLTTRQGRISKNCMRRRTYQYTRPCERGETCPHERDPEDCEAMSPTTAHACPSSVALHAIRRGAITTMLSDDDTPTRAVSDRVDASKEVLDKHYDSRSEKSKMEKRRQFFS
jgi:site-specific recombinase XerD